MGCSSSVSINTDINDHELRLLLDNKSKIIVQYEMSKLYPKNEDNFLTIKQLDREINTQLEILTQRQKMNPSLHFDKTIDELIEINSDLIIRWNKILKHSPENNTDDIIITDENLNKENTHKNIKKDDINLNKNEKMEKDIEKNDKELDFGNEKIIQDDIKISNEVKDSKEEIENKKDENKIINDAVKNDENKCNIKDVEEQNELGALKEIEKKIDNIEPNENMVVNDPNNNILTGVETINQNQNKIENNDKVNNNEENVENNNKVCNFNEDDDMVNYNY